MVEGLTLDFGPGHDLMGHGVEACSASSLLKILLCALSLKLKKKKIKKFPVVSVPANCHPPSTLMVLVTRTRHPLLDIPNHLILIDGQTETLRTLVSHLANTAGLWASLCPVAKLVAFPDPTCPSCPSYFIVPFSYPLAVGMSPT